MGACSHIQNGQQLLFTSSNTVGFWLLSLVAGAEGDTPRGERHVHDGHLVVSTNPTHAKQASEILRNPCGR